MSLIGFNTNILSPTEIIDDILLEDGVTVVSTNTLSLISEVGGTFEVSILVSTNDGSLVHPITYSLISDDIYLDIIEVDASNTIINVSYSPLIIENGSSILTLNFDNNGVNIPFNVALNYKSTIPSSEFIVSPLSITFGELGSLDSAEQFITITCNTLAFDLTYLDFILSSTDLDSLEIRLTYDSRVGNEIKYKVTFMPLYNSTTNVELQFTYNNIKVCDMIPITGSKASIPDMPITVVTGSTAPSEPVNMLIPFKNTSGSMYRITEVINNNDMLDEFTISNLALLLGTVMSSGEVMYVALLYTPKKATTTYPNITLKGIAFNNALQVIEYTPLPQITFVKPPSNDPLPENPSNPPYNIPIDGGSVGGSYLPSSYSITTTAPYTQSGSDIKDFVFNTPATFKGTNVFYRLNFVTDLQYTPTVTFSSDIHTGDNITITFGNFESDTTVTNSHANVNSTLTNTWPLSTPIITTSLFSQIDGIKTAQFIFHPSEKVVNVNYEVIPSTGGTDNTLPNVTFSNFGNDTTVTAGNMQTPIGLSGTAYYLTTSFFNQNVGSVSIQFTFHPSEKVVDVNYTVSALVIPTYTITPTNTIYDENSIFGFTLTTTNVAQGTQLLWGLEVVSGNFVANGANINISDVSPVGGILYTNAQGSAIFSGSIRADDLTEGVEVFRAYVTTPEGVRLATSSNVTINDTSVNITLPKVVFSSYNVAQNQSITITFSDFGDDTSVTSSAGSWGLLTPVTYQPQLTMTASNVDFFNQWLGNSVIPFTFNPSGRVVNVNYTVTPAVELTMYNTVLDADKTSVHEGESITYTFTTTANVLDGTTIIYIITESALDGTKYKAVGTGTFVLINKSASVTYSPLAGSLARGIRLTGLDVGVNRIRSYVANLVA